MKRGISMEEALKRRIFCRRARAVVSVLVFVPLVVAKVSGENLWVLAFVALALLFVVLYFAEAAYSLAVAVNERKEKG